MNYYNEHDPKAAAWLRELIASNLIAPGIVDERSITEVNADELAEYIQCHFFAGIGGWSYALRLAGWPDERPVWTGSCPCQPFSCAGKSGGFSDERHLWPEFFRLIKACNPATVFGEQVASKLGREWLAGVFADLEALGYSRAGADLCAAGVGAPHIRQRLYWMADMQGDGRKQRRAESGGRGVAGNSGASGVGNSESVRRAGRADGEDGRRGQFASANPCETSGMDDTERDRCAARRNGDHGGNERQFAGAAEQVGFWSNFDAIPCRDGKARRVESGTFPLAHGVSHRVGLLRGYGNAIVPQVAAAFIKSAAECF